MAQDPFQSLDKKTLSEQNALLTEMLDNPSRIADSTRKAEVIDVKAKGKTP